MKSQCPKTELIGTFEQNIYSESKMPLVLIY